VLFVDVDPRDQEDRDAAIVSDLEASRLIERDARLLIAAAGGVLAAR